MEPEKIVYENRGFIITEHPRIKQYPDEMINEHDKVYRIKINGINQPTIDDAVALAFYLLKNKIYDGAFDMYRNKFLKAIHNADFERNNKETNDSIDEWM